MPIETVLAPNLPRDRSAIVEGTPQDDAPLQGQGVQSDSGTPDQSPLNADPSLQKPQSPWLLKPESDVAKEIELKWEATAKPMKHNLERCKLNEMRRAGDTYSKLVSNPDQDSVKVYTPMGSQSAPPSLAKTDELCEKMIANLMVDPPVAECEPAKDDDKARDAAEFATRFLEDQASESSLNVPLLLHKAEDLACSWGSGFVRVYADPAKGGSKPVSIIASQAALTPEDALTTMAPDPQTGEMVPTPQPGPYVERYVGYDGKLTDDPTQAKREWIPKLCADVMTGRNFRLLPSSAQSIDDAIGCLIAAYIPFGAAKQLYPAIASYSPEEQRKLVGYRPIQSKNLLPPNLQGTTDGTTLPNSADKGPPDDALLLTITAIMVDSPDHPGGAYVVMAGGTRCLERIEWTRNVTDPSTGKKDVKANSLPVAQFRQFLDSKDQDPLGRGLVDKLIDGDPVLALAMGSLIERVSKANNPHLFVPINSGISDKALSLPRGTPIPYSAANGTIQYEQLTPFSPEVLKLYEITSDRMNSRSGLEETAQGLESPDSQSGVAKELVVQRSLIALTLVKQGFETGFQRLNRVILEQAQMVFTQPQMLKVVGDDGAYKFQEFTSADLGSTVDVRIKAGTSTMLAPSAKEEITLGRVKAGLVTIQDAQDMLRSGLRSLTGMEDDPSLLRVKRQIEAWKQGPPEGWEGPPPPQQVPGQPMMDNATGQAVQGPPQTVQPPDPANPFADTLPVDSEQDVAVTRHYYLRRVVSSTAFARKPDPWKQYLLAEYAKSKQEAGIMTVQEQAQSASNQFQQQLLLKETPNVTGSAKIGATDVGQFIQADRAAWQGQPQSGQAPQTPPQAPGTNPQKAA